MKTTLFILTFAILAYVPGKAQQHLSGFTFYTGYAIQQKPQLSSLLVNRDMPLKEFEFNLTEVAKQFHFGIRKNISFQRPFFGTVGLEYTQQHQTYSCRMINTPNPEGNYKINASNKTIMLPVGIGVHLGPVEVTNGMMAQFNFQSKLSGENTMGIETSKNDTSVGWYSGVSIRLGFTSFGVSYQSSFSRDASNLTNRGKSMELASVPGNVMFTMGFSF
ncbi:MAG: hypothetical protein ABIQ02_12435 [Saprospiraceae bacterium]